MEAKKNYGLLFKRYAGVFASNEALVEMKIKDLCNTRRISSLYLPPNGELLERSADHAYARLAE